MAVGMRFPDMTRKDKDLLAKALTNTTLTNASKPVQFNAHFSETIRFLVQKLSISICRSICSYIYLSVYLSIYLSGYLSINLFIYPNMYRYLELSACSCMYKVCVHTCIHIYIRVLNIYTFLCICICMYILKYIYTCTYVPIHTSMYIYIACVSLYIHVTQDMYMYMYIYIYVYAHVYVHIYIHAYLYARAHTRFQEGSIYGTCLGQVSWASRLGLYLGGLGIVRGTRACNLECFLSSILSPKSPHGTARFTLQFYAIICP